MLETDCNFLVWKSFKTSGFKFVEGCGGGFGLLCGTSLLSGRVLHKMGG